MSADEHYMWDGLNVEYENAYHNNPFKKAVVEKAISLLKPGSRVLDVGCGTGVPVAQMLADAGMDVVGTDVAPNMVMHAKRRVKGSFEVADMVNYEPKGSFSAVFIIYSQLGLSYAAFHAAAYRFAKALESGGLIVLGQSPAGAKIAPDDPAWDETKTFVEGYNLPFVSEYIV
jgi:SAM-dependent methyltransferase